MTVSLGITAPEDWLKVRPDIMMVDFATDDLQDKGSRVGREPQSQQREDFTEEQDGPAENHYFGNRIRR